MPNPGDFYTVSIKQSHLDWGGHRYTDTREKIEGEAYVKIPKEYAIRYDIMLGNCYIATFSDGFESFPIRAAGNSSAGDPYAKQFQGDGDLKAFGRWYTHVKAEIGDDICVTFLDQNTVNFELIKRFL